MPCSQCRFLNCDCKNDNPLIFHDKSIYKCCGHDIDLHIDSAISADNSALTTLPLAPTSQCSDGTVESKSENTTQGPPNPNHKQCVPSTPGETSETAAHSSNSNNHLRLKQIIPTMLKSKKNNWKKKKVLSSLSLFILTQTCIY